MSAEPFAFARRGLPLAGPPRRRAPAPWLASFAFPRARAVVQPDAQSEAQPEPWAEDPVADERLPEEARIDARDDEVEEEEDAVPAQPRTALASLRSKRIEIAANPSTQPEPAAESDMAGLPRSPGSPAPESPRAPRRAVAAAEAPKGLAAAARVGFPPPATQAAQMSLASKPIAATVAGKTTRTSEGARTTEAGRRSAVTGNPPQPTAPAGTPERIPPVPVAPATATMPMGAPQGVRQVAEAQHDEPRIHAALAAAAAAQRRERARTATAGGRAGERAGVTRIGTVHVVVQAPPPQPVLPPRPAAPSAAQAALQPPGAARRPAPAFRSPWSSRRRGE
jgi:hypothetical protein